VVDAGGEGFVDLLRGILEFASTGVVEEAPEALARLAAGEETDMTDTPPDEHRYCTECVIHGSDIELGQLRAALATMGSSLVVAGSSRKAKVHIHVDRPDEVFRLAERFGEVHGQKADDMHQQRREAARDTEQGVAIITDSGADLPAETLERLDIHLVPVRVNFGARGYLDKVSLSPTEFYRELARNPEPPKTSQPPPGDFRRQFQLLSSHYAAVVSINITEKVSGTYQSALNAAERADGAPVSVLDSRNISVGQGLLVLYAAECAAAGYESGALIEAVTAMRERTRAWGILRELAPGVRGGRVKAPIKWLADGLRLTPVLRATADGRIAAGGILPGRRRALERFARFIARRMRGDGRYRVMIAHGDCPADAARFENLLRQRCKAELDRVWQVELGCALGAHAGPGAIVVGVQEYQPPKA